MMLKAVLILFTLASVLSPFGNLKAANGNEDRIIAVAQGMEAAFKSLEDYTCEVEQVFYRDGVEDQQFRFKYYFKKEKKIRIDFSYPYSGLTVFYRDEDREATVVPLRFLSVLKVRISIDSSLIKTLAGQRINQTDMGYFVGFIFQKPQEGRTERE